MIVVLTLFIIVSCVSAVCILSHCKSRLLKSNETPVPSSVSTSSSQSRSQPPSVFIVPTTSQVMEMYLSQANCRSQPTEPECGRPPSYGHVIVDVPPSYEQAVERSRY